MVKREPDELNGVVRPRQGMWVFLIIFQKIVYRDKRLQNKLLKKGDVLACAIKR